MAVNRYHKAAPIEYVSQYVPIPFEELVTLGKHYAAERRAAEEQLTQHLKSASDFNSLITKDNESYYNTVMNDNVMSVVDQLVKDPNLMKTSAGRQMLNSAINSVNYGDLAKLKASAKQAEMYKAAVQKLAIEGKMPPGWEPDYFNTYDTLKENKVFDATPLAWQSRNAIVHEYVNHLKPGYIDTKNGYDVYGVSEERTLAQVNAAESEIMNLDVIQRNLEKRSAIYQKMGMSEEDAFIKAYSEEWDEIKNEAREKAWFDRRENKYSLLQKQAELAGKDQSSNINTRIAEHQATSENVIINKYTKELDELASVIKLNGNVKFNDLTDNEQKEVLKQLYNNIQERGLTKDDMTPMNQTEYYNWSGAKIGKDWVNGNTVTDKDGNPIQGKDGENYSFRHGDTMYTLEGKSLRDVDASIFGDATDRVNFTDILAAIQNDALYNMSGNVHPYLDENNQNFLQTDGYLYITEDALESAIDIVSPGKGSKIKDFMIHGVYENNKLYYKILEQVDGKINGEGNVYRMRVGRGFGNIPSFNTDHNRNYIKDVAGSNTVAKNYPNITGSSWIESGK